MVFMIFGKEAAGDESKRVIPVEFEEEVHYKHK